MRMTLNELIAELEAMRNQHGGHTLVALYDQHTWEELPNLTVEFSPGDPGVLILGNNTPPEE
jgi:hypothetical protein